MRHKIFGVALAIILSVVVLSDTVNAYFIKTDNFTSGEIINQIEASLTEGYQEYYDIDHFDITLCDDGTYFVEMFATLKADSVEELDYYQGAMQYMADNLSADGNSVEQAEKLYENLSVYIGKEQVLNFYIMPDIVRSNQTSTCRLLYEDGFNYVSAEDIYPPNHDELFNNGYSYMENSVESSMQGYSTTSSDSNNSNFSVTNAVLYASKYTSNPTSCNLHTNCGMLVDTTKYNPNYTHYASTHSDCANFVSQTLYAGGIPTSATWYAGSTKWVNVANLSTYMLDNGYWEAIDKSALFVGDYMRYTGKGESHIVMITAHDGVSYRYCGHTNDRQNVVTGLSGSLAFYHVIY